MADSGIKKIFYRSQDFPLVQFTTHIVNGREEILDLYYAFRYRILSEDKNRFSHWSRIKKIIMPDVTTPFPYTSDARITVSKSGNPETVNAIWRNPTTSENPTEYEQIFNKISIYDVWLRWTDTNNATEISNGWTNWQYVATVSSNNFSTIKPQPSYKTVEVAIQIPTTKKIRDYNSNKLTLFKKFGAV